MSKFLGNVFYKQWHFLFWFVLLIGIAGIFYSIVSLFSALSSLSEKNTLTSNKPSKSLTILELMDEGFVIKNEQHTQTLKWSHIKYIVAYREEMYTTNRLVTEIVYDKQVYNIRSDWQGWNEWVLHLNKNLSIAAPNWPNQLQQTDLGKNRMLIYTYQKAMVKR